MASLGRRFVDVGDREDKYDGAALIESAHATHLQVDDRLIH